MTQKEFQSLKVGQLVFWKRRSGAKEYLGIILDIDIEKIKIFYLHSKIHTHPVYDYNFIYYF